MEELEERGRCRALVPSHLCDPNKKQVGNLHCAVNMSADGGCDLTCQALCCLCCVNIGDLRKSKVIQRIACCRVMLFAVCSVCLFCVTFILFALTLYASQSEIRGDCFSAIWSLNSGLDKIPPANDYSGVYTRFLSPCTYTPEIKQNTVIPRLTSDPANECFG